MTDLLMPEDVAETRVLVHPQPYLSVVDTAVITPPWPTGAELVVAGRPTAPPPSRPDHYRGKRRAADPPWVWALIGAGAVLLGEALAAAVLLLAVA